MESTELPQIVLKYLHVSSEDVHDDRIFIFWVNKPSKKVLFLVYCQLKLNTLSDNAYWLSIQSIPNGHNQVPSYILHCLRSHCIRIYVTKRE